MKKLFRGEKAGVFAGSNGYYAAWMAADGVSHYQEPGGGWSASDLRRANAEARLMEAAEEDQ